MPYLGPTSPFIYDDYRRIGLVLGLGVLLPATGQASAASAISAISAPSAPSEERTLDLSDDTRMMPGSADAAPLRTPLPPHEAPKEPTPYVVYMALDGPTLIKGQVDDATRNQTGFAGCEGPWPKYDEAGMGPQMGMALVQAVKEDWAAFNVEIVTERPAAGPYVMAIAGKKMTCGSGSGGYANQDCKGAQNDVVFALVSSGGTLLPGHEAAVVSQEIAHAIGLAHDGTATSILNPQINGADAGNYDFKNTCLTYSGLSCGPLGGCPNGQQNAVQHILDVIGPRPGTSGGDTSTTTATSATTSTTSGPNGTETQTSGPGSTATTTQSTGQTSNPLGMGPEGEGCPCTASKGVLGWSAWAPWLATGLAIRRRRATAA